jgi:hypothetical protein
VEVLADAEPARSSEGARCEEVKPPRAQAEVLDDAVELVRLGCVIFSVSKGRPRARLRGRTHRVLVGKYNVGVDCARLS